MPLKMHARREIWTNSISIQIGEERPFGFFAARPLEFVAFERGHICEPCMSLDYADAQLLMDELWSAGIRPSEGTGSAGSLAATERHLKDMRAIAFGSLAKADIVVVGEVS